MAGPPTVPPRSTTGWPSPPPTCATPGRSGGRLGQGEVEVVGLPGRRGEQQGERGRRRRDPGESQAPPRWGGAGEVPRPVLGGAARPDGDGLELHVGASRRL